MTASDGLDAARRALSGSPAWLVGGAVRDSLLGRASADFDLVVDGDPAAAARAVAHAARPAACFALSEEFGSWRVVARDGSWQIDVEPLRAPALEQDLALRDFTLNAIAEPLAGGELIDPLGGAADLRAGRLRMAGPGAFADDPLRVLRLVRMSVELSLIGEPQTLRAAAAQAPALSRVSGERVFIELRRIVASEAPRAGLELMASLGASAVVLPELDALAGVAQNRFHHADVLGHTLEVLDRVVALAGKDARSLGGGGDGAQETQDGRDADATAERTLAEHRGEVDALLAEPLADEMTRGEALRWGALLHDAAKPLTIAHSPADGRVTFLGHDRRGAALAREVLGRLRASERMRAHVAALVLNHLRLGFLVHEPQPLARRTVYSYLRTCAPVEVDVTLLSIADRLATRGAGSAQAIEKHLALGQRMLADALAWRASGGAPAPLLRGDDLARELGISPGPELGRLLEELSAARYAGEITSREEALASAHRLIGTMDG
jgi:poly(A) polymerase